MPRSASRWCIATTSSDPTLLRACAAIALDLDEFGVAHECAARALSRGYEPSWNLLRLAWFASRRDDTSGARTLFTRTITSAGPRSARLDVAWHFKTAIDFYSYETPGWGSRNSRIAGQIHEASATKDDGSFWLDLPQVQLLPWIERETGEGNQNGWRSLSDPAALTEHFASVAFAGELFRDCLPDEDAAVCKSSDWRKVHARRLRFWDVDGTPVAVVTFMPVAHVTQDSLVTTIRQEDDQGRGRTDTVGARLTGAGGLVAVPSNDAWESWTLDIDPRRPAQQVDFEDFQPSAGMPPLILSDLAVGPPTGAATWMHGGAAIPIAATSTFSHTTRLQLFYQVRCDTGCGGIEWSIAIRSAGGSRPLTLSSRATLHAGINDVTRELDLTHVAAGSYRLEVEIRTDAARSVRRTSELIVK